MSSKDEILFEAIFELGQLDTEKMANFINEVKTLQKVLFDSKYTSEQKLNAIFDIALGSDEMRNNPNLQATIDFISDEINQQEIDLHLMKYENVKESEHRIRRLLNQVLIRIQPTYKGLGETLKERRENQEDEEEEI